MLGLRSPSVSRLLLALDLADVPLVAVVLGLLFITIALAVRRRRAQRANISYINPPSVEQNPNQYPYQRNTQGQDGNLQYPPQTYAYPPYDPSTGFAPVSVWKESMTLAEADHRFVQPQGAPPAYYPSSQGPPPGKEAV